MTSIALYSDYVYPYCLLAKKVLSDAISDRDIAITWHPFELRPAPEPTLRPENPYLPSVWQRSVYPLAERFGVPIRLPSISPQPRTAKAFELPTMDQDQDQELDNAYSLFVLLTFFQEDLDIGQLEILIELVAEIGLDPDEARRALENGTYAQRHREAQRHAREDMQITSAPTIAVGKQVFRGASPLDELKLAIDQLGNQPNGVPSPASPQD